MRKIVVIAFGVALLSAPASALTIDPNAGLVDFVFSFDGTNVSFSGDADLSLTLASPSFLSFHVEDCCIDGDEWALYANGVLTPWTFLESNGGDGAPNGGAFMGPGSTYFEALGVLTLPAGVNLLDMVQTAGIPGGSYLNMSQATPIPEPATLLLLGTGLGAVAARRRKRARP